jgi:hypothetical protein
MKYVNAHQFNPFTIIPTISLAIIYPLTNVQIPTGKVKAKVSLRLIISTSAVHVIECSA